MKINAKVIIIILLIVSACKNSSINNNNSQLNVPFKKYSSLLESPSNGSRFKCNEAIDFIVKTIDSTHIDSLKITFDQEKTVTLLKAPYVYELNGLKVGRVYVSVEVFLRQKEKEIFQIALMLLSDISSANIKYKVIKEYNHDNQAYTQGLIFEKGFMFESTGLYGKSSLRKIDFTTGKVLKFTNVNEKYFAEGIAKIGNKIYQLTWREKTCFVYDAETFNQINEILLPVAEGWGLTFDNKQLILSDGSSSIYFLNPETFFVERKIGVADENEAIDNLNELEFINNKIFSNVYGEDIVVIIDPETGKVTGKINFKDLLPNREKYQNIDVLNGISYNATNNHLFITGKNWPKMFEIELTK